MATIERGFYPYTDNGGSCLAVAGEDYCIVAADTRQSEGYSINARYVPKAFQLTDRAVLTHSGFSADGVQLVKRIHSRIQMYKHHHDKEMSTPAMAQMLSIMLYHKRFFPYYVHNILAGLDEEGRGCVYSYDPVGSFERETCRAGGSASQLLQPLLDNQIGFKNLTMPRVALPKEQVRNIVIDAFTSATERDIHTGDYLELFTITKEGVKKEIFDLKKD